MLNKIENFKTIKQEGKQFGIKNNGIKQKRASKELRFDNKKSNKEYQGVKDKILWTRRPNRSN